MTENQGKFECSLGFHEYIIPWEKDPDTLICKHCLRFGHYIRFYGGFETWIEFDNKGNEIHFKNSYGYEAWYEYDDKGNVIHFYDSYGCDKWKVNGHWTTKPRKLEI